MPENKKADNLDEILREKFTNAFRKGYTTVNNCTMPLRYLDLKDDIDDFQVSEEDVWICSFPKTAIFDFRDLKKNNPDFKPPPFLDDSIKFVKNQPHPLCIKTHLPWDLLPKQIQNGSKKPKIVYVTRNSNDTCISYYHHCRLMEGFRGTFDEFCRLFLAGKVTYGPFWSHVLQFWQRRNDSNVLFLKYEDMKVDLAKVIRQVAQFLERDLSDDQVEVLTKHLSFEAMKTNQAVNYEMVVEFSRKFKLIDCDGVFMRSGTVGGYKGVMDKDILEQFEDWNQKNTKGCEYVL